MTKNFDIAVIGAGLNGMTMAISMAHHGLNVALLDKFDVNKMLDEGFDGRTSAISFGSKSFFEELGIWQEIVKDAGEIRDIRIIDADLEKGDSRLFLHFNHADAKHDEPMGWIAENRYLRTVFLNYLKDKNNVSIYSPAEITDLKNDGNWAEIHTNGEIIKAKLAVLADGKSSNFAERLGINKHFSDYKQKAIVLGVKHSLSHHKCATERFMPGGPFAILPMKDEHLSAVVWSDNTELVDALMALPQEELMQQVRNRFGTHLGNIELATKVFSYPLYLNYARKHYAKRVALIGDSAHGIHPIAGQGYNQGVKDIRDLTDLVTQTQSLGLDIGGEQLLKDYQAKRVIDNMQMVAATDFFNRFFSNNSKTLKTARRLGIAAVHKLPKVKAFFINRAMGK
jgi:2-octaprenyl-6-methoxyphenol hydroxylase